MRNLTLQKVVTVAAAVLVGGCSPAAQPKTPPATLIEPQADLDPGTGCTLQLGVAKVNALFAAINHGDAKEAASIFPREGEGFVIQPMFEFDELDQKATTPEEVAAIVQGLAGIHIVFRAPLQGSAGRVDYTLEANQKISVWSVSLGDVLWQATRNGRSYRGGGKITFNCEDGKFLRVVF